MLEVRSFKYEDDWTVHRMFIKGRNYPGLCMSRSPLGPHDGIFIESVVFLGIFIKGRNYPGLCMRRSPLGPHDGPGLRKVAQFL